MNKTRYVIKQNGGLLIRDDTFNIDDDKLHELENANDSQTYNEIVINILRELDYNIHMVIGAPVEYLVNKNLYGNKLDYGWLVNYDVSLTDVYFRKITHPLSLCIDFNNQEILDRLCSKLNGRFTKIIFDKNTSYFVTDNPILTLIKLYELLAPSGRLYVDDMIFGRSRDVLIDRKTSVEFINNRYQDILNFRKNRKLFIDEKVRKFVDNNYIGNPFLMGVTTYPHNNIIPEDCSDINITIREINVEFITSLPCFKWIMYRIPNEAQYPLNLSDSTNTIAHFVFSKNQF
jgi:hypothetical protein